MQDLVLFVVIGVLAGLFWLQKCGNDTVGAAQNTLGESRMSQPAISMVILCETDVLLVHRLRNLLEPAALLDVVEHFPSQSSNHCELPSFAHSGRLASKQP